MTRQRNRDTAPELALRRELHRRGLRFRIHRPVLPGLNRRSDIVFTRAGVVVDVRGCFWHQCPEHGTRPAANAMWWETKLSRTVYRDKDTERRLLDAGWVVIVVWEHEDAATAADHVEDVVGSRLAAI